MEILSHQVQNYIYLMQFRIYAEIADILVVCSVYNDHICIGTPNKFPL